MGSSRRAARVALILFTLLELGYLAVAGASYFLLGGCVFVRGLGSICGPEALPHLTWRLLVFSGAALTISAFGFFHLRRGKRLRRPDSNSDQA